MIQGVIFDMDGLMFDTEGLFLTIFPAMAQENGLNVTSEDAKRLVGCDESMAKGMEADFPGITSVLHNVWQPNRIPNYKKLYPIPGSLNKKGLQELVTWLEDHHIPWAVASSSPKAEIQALCDHAGFAMHPNALISSRDGLASKPDPAVFLEAARVLGQDPENCLVLEDSKFGVMAAKAGGFRCAWIPDVIVPDEEMAKAIDMEMESLLTVRDWLEAQQNSEQ